MGQNAKQLTGADAAGNLLYFSPEKLTLVTDKAHPLYDERVNLPLDEALVRNIMMYGVKVSVIIRRNGNLADGTPINEVVDGRQRVRACTEANIRLAAEGKETHRVPATQLRADAGTLMGVMISTNELRKGDDLLVKARKLGAYLATNKTEEEAAITFGVHKNTIRYMLQILDLHPDVQAVIEKGEASATVLKELSKLPQEDQPAALAKLVEAGATTGARGVEAVRSVVKREGGEKTGKVKTKPNKRTRKQLEEWKTNLQQVSGKPSEVAQAVLAYILGKDRALANFPQLREAFPKE